MRVAIASCSILGYKYLADRIVVLQRQSGGLPAPGICSEDMSGAEFMLNCASDSYEMRADARSVSPNWTPTHALSTICELRIAGSILQNRSKTEQNRAKPIVSSQRATLILRILDARESH